MTVKAITYDLYPFHLNQTIQRSPRALYSSIRIHQCFSTHLFRCFVSFIACMRSIFYLESAFRYKFPQNTIPTVCSTSDTQCASWRDFHLLLGGAKPEHATTHHSRQFPTRLLICTTIGTEQPNSQLSGSKKLKVNLNTRRKCLKAKFPI